MYTLYYVMTFHASKIDELKNSDSRNNSTVWLVGMASEPGSFWKKFFREQFHYSKFLTCHEDVRAFVYTPVSVGTY